MHGICHKQLTHTNHNFKKQHLLKRQNLAMNKTAVHKMKGQTFPKTVSAFLQNVVKNLIKTRCLGLAHLSLITSNPRVGIILRIQDTFLKYRTRPDLTGSNSLIHAGIDSVLLKNKQPPVSNEAAILIRMSCLTWSEK